MAQQRTRALAVRQEAFDEDGVIVINPQHYDGANLLTPVTTIRRTNPHMGVLTAVVKLDGKRDFFKVGYDKALGGSMFTPTATGLFKLMEAAGIHGVASEPIEPSVCGKCRKVNSGRSGGVIKCWECPHEYDVAHTVTLRQQQADGTYQTLKTTYELDFPALKEQLESEAAEAAKRTRKPPRDVNSQVAAMRRHRVARAETGAYNRGLRKLLKIHNKYSEAETTRPFVVHRVYVDISSLPTALQIAALTEADAVIEQAAALLGPPPAPEPASDYDDDVVDAEVVEVDDEAEIEPEPEIVNDVAPEDILQFIPDAWCEKEPYPKVEKRILDFLGSLGIGSLAEAVEILGGVPSFQEIEAPESEFIQAIRAAVKAKESNRLL